VLRIYSDALLVCREAARVARVLDSRDRDLARQLRRCSSSVVLNIAEGSASQGGNKRSRYFSALGSIRETRACFEVAVVMDYVAPLSEVELDRIEKVTAVLTKLSMR